MTQPDRLLDDVTESFDALRAAGDPYDGLIPSVLDRESGEMYSDVPGRIQAQRDGDRSHCGANLLYDVPLLHAMLGVGATDGNERHAEAADRYAERFVTHCADTATGIFPWGDHAYWNLAEDRVGNSAEYHPHGYPDSDDAVHDHCRAVPVWLWERLHDLDPGCVQDFADELDYHWTSELRRTFNRHAYITTEDRRMWDPEDAACDFPRHTGFFVLTSRSRIRSSNGPKRGRNWRDFSTTGGIGAGRSRGGPTRKSSRPRATDGRSNRTSTRPVGPRPASSEPR